MVENKKKNVSVRMNNTDLKKVKEIASRLQVRESDVFRFAIKSTLAKLTPLNDVEAKGIELMPVFMEYGHELTNYFELDTSRLDLIINAGIEENSKRVDREDIELLAMSGAQENYVYLKLKELAGDQAEPHRIKSLLQQYFSDKYIHGKSSSTDSDANTDSNIKRISAHAVS